MTIQECDRCGKNTKTEYNKPTIQMIHLTFHTGVNEHGYREDTNGKSADLCVSCYREVEKVLTEVLPKVVKE